MTSCELCGKLPSVYECEIEGTKMKVCTDCSRFGKVKGKSNVRVVYVESKKPVSSEPEYAFVQGYGMKVKNAREKTGLKQEDFAKSINEHKSLIHQVESESIKPSLILAKKLERALKIIIIEELKNIPNPTIDTSRPEGFIAKPGFKSKEVGLTLGDMIHFKNKGKK